MCSNTKISLFIVVYCETSIRSNIIWRERFHEGRMADFSEWYEGTGGDGFGDDAADAADAASIFDGSAAASALSRDAVLFLVDCSASMFSAVAAAPLPTPTGPATGPASSSPFSQVLRAIMTFYQDKIITSDKDYVGLVLYNTRQALNRYDFPSVYTFHEMDSPGAPRVQELEVLALAGKVTSDVYKQFFEHIGHIGTSRSLAGDGEKKIPVGAPAHGPSSLPEALWAAQHMFHHLPTKNVAFRRIFIFTDCDEPCTGLAKDRCFARRKDLHEAGVIVEVFAHGHDAVSTVASQSSAPTAGAVSASTGAAGASLGSTIVGTAMMPLPLSPTRAASPAGAATSGPVKLPPTSRPFNRGLFWDSFISFPLQKAFAMGTALITGGSSCQYDDIGEYCGGVSVSDNSAFEGLLSNVRLRTYPQRVAGKLTVRIGPSSDAPRFAAAVFIPVMKCPKPKFTWLESSTNGLVTAESRLLCKTTGSEVTPQELKFATAIGGSEVLFSKDEAEAMRHVGGHRGITILGFKKASDVLRVKFCVSRSSFLHVDREDGGSGSMKLFVQLHRTLSEQGKVAVAEMSVRGPPRLCVLAPSASDRGASALGAPAYHPTDDAVVGCGFHVFFLPYADDLRSLQFPQPGPTVGDAALTAAKKTVRKLSVDYDPLAIANPSLQRRYHLLQRLALMDPDGSSDPPDVTLPDLEGMSKYKPIFAEFSAAVFPPGYVAESIVPPPKPSKPPPSADELKKIDFDALEKANKLSSLTIPYLRQYLATQKADANGASLKHELVERVAEVVRQKRGQIKRERDEAADE